VCRSIAREVCVFLISPILLLICTSATADTYVAQPYNFNVSPLFIEGDRLRISRDITFSTKNVQFLIDHSFDIGAIFTKGVPYLSREEETTARRIFMKSQDKSSQIPDLIVQPGDAEALDFYNRVRKTIYTFVNQKKVCRRFLRISGNMFFPYTIIVERLGVISGPVGVLRIITMGNELEHLQSINEHYRQIGSF
jgi:hypothetical protein